jgi:hypothetical protein
VHLQDFRISKKLTGPYTGHSGGRQGRNCASARRQWAVLCHFYQLQGRLGGPPWAAGAISSRRERVHRDTQIGGPHSAPTGKSTSFMILFLNFVCSRTPVRLPFCYHHVIFKSMWMNPSSTILRVIESVRLGRFLDVYILLSIDTLLLSRIIHTCMYRCLF